MVISATPSATTATSSTNTQSGNRSSAGRDTTCRSSLSLSTCGIYYHHFPPRPIRLSTLVYSECCCRAVCKSTTTLPLCLRARSGKEEATPRTTARSYLNASSILRRACARELLSRARGKKRGVARGEEDTMLLSVTLRAVGRRLKATRSMPVSLSPRGTSTLMESGGASSDWGVEDKPHPATGQRLLRAAVLGLPNAGKTTLVNQLVGRKVRARNVQNTLCLGGRHDVQ